MKHLLVTALLAAGALAVPAGKSCPSPSSEYPPPSYATPTPTTSYPSPSPSNGGGKYPPPPPPSYSTLPHNGGGEGNGGNGGNGGNNGGGNGGNGGGNGGDGGNNGGGNNGGGNNGDGNNGGGGNGNGNGGDEYECPKSLFSNLQCCSTDVLGLADLDCKTPSNTPANGDDFQAICARDGRQPKCCVLPILGQSLLCQDAPGTA
ncbi:hypothetical protein TGAM01_v202154 [Trichoderma gamsii]|uniref:Hydrophobin n=1 Tax=Trichoderma gamsii TaxID=398673 RepID=A0A2P4ZXP1_9HYPO|nr:hypothetical protein TGAM01_v202154 [Trichoderma gamsii]PON29046.1 hypothetical protein TGAM01_v202154 [Trichoderma gamsii]